MPHLLRTDEEILELGRTAIEGTENDTLTKNEWNRYDLLVETDGEEYNWESPQEDYAYGG